jgi:hypothetical protein
MSKPDDSRNGTNAEAMGRPSLTRGRTKLDYFAGMIGLPDSCAPEVLNKSWTIIAEVELPDNKTNGTNVAGGRLERTVPIKFSICEGLDVGMDGGSPVDFSYQVPFAFGGTVEKVSFELKPQVSSLPGEGAEVEKVKGAGVARA